MTAQITELLSAADGYETVRDAVAVILTEEIEAQRMLAGADSEDYSLDVYVERFAPLEAWADEENEVPVATVWLARYVNDRAKSTVDSQRGEATYYVDVFAQAKDADNPVGGHIAGDLLSRKRLHRAIRLIRQILMSGHYTYLGSPRGSSQYVFHREVTDVEIHESRRRDEKASQWIATARMTLKVSLRVTQPQVLPVEWSGIDLTAKRLSGTPDGKVLAKASYENS